MPYPMIADRRIELARAFTQGRVELPRLEQSRLRFSLGTSVADLKVPFHIARDAERIFTQSARQLTLMLVSRHRDLLKAEEFDRFLINDEFAALPTAGLTLAPGSGGSDVRNTAFLSNKLHPALTGGVMATWLGPGGGGRSLVALVIEVLRKAFTEMTEDRAREETPTLVALMLGSLFGQTDTGMKKMGLSVALDRYFRSATGVGLFLAIRLGAERAARDVKPPAGALERVDAVLSPVPLLGGRATMFGGVCQLYGADLAFGVPLIDDVLTRLSAKETPEALIDALALALGRNDEHSRRAETAVALSTLRGTSLQLALLGEQGQLPPELTEQCRQLAIRPERLLAGFADEKARKELIGQLTRVTGEQSSTAKAAFGSLLLALKGFKEREPAASSGHSRAAARGSYARASVAAICDLWMERAVAPVRALLEVRSGTELEGGLETQYASGHLYRVSAGSDPILTLTAQNSMGHLFVDVKDFTRRTSLLGQVAIAEFLRREFYLPILSAAKNHYGGMSHLLDKGGVTINNLLGDAISVSGGLEAVVGLARDIRQLLLNYERQLAKAVGTTEVAQAVKAIEAEYARKAQQATPEQLAALTSERELALARARGEGLEAGVFISFGPAPLVVTLDDEVFGHARVAIADRINESARGTARSGGARARADAMLAAEIARRNDPKLVHPWAVFVGAPFTISIPTRTEDAARAALKAQDLRGAMVAVAEAVKAAVEELGRTEDRPGDIYNAGAALSEEALLAYRDATGDRKLFRELEVMPQSLHPEIRKRYYFPPTPVRLLLGFEPQKKTLVEIFRYVGRVMFKGLERSGGIAVWELVDEAGVGSLLTHHHGVEWLKG